MSAKEIKATNPKTNTSATIAYDFGEGVDDAVAKFGADVVFSNFVSASTITAQGAIRRYLGKGLSEEEIAQKMSEWKPGVALTREAGDPMEAAAAKFGAMTPEEQQAYIEKLKAKAAGAQQ